VCSTELRCRRPGSRQVPAIIVEVGAQTLSVEAPEVIGAERDDLWRRLIVLRPGMAEYETRTSLVSLAVHQIAGTTNSWLSQSGAAPRRSLPVPPLGGWPTSVRRRCR